MRADPLAARQRFEEAQRLAAAPWPTRVAALRAVLGAASEADPLRRRVMESLAQVLRQAGIPHGAAAWLATAVRLGPSRDRGRLGSVFRLAGLLLAEEDPRAAAPLLEEVARLSRSLDPRLADRASVLRAGLAADQGDRPALEALARGLAREGGAPTARLEVLGALGVVCLERGDGRGAGRALAQARACYLAALAGKDEEEARRAAQAWLDLDLRRRLGTPSEDSPGG